MNATVPGQTRADDPADDSSEEAVLAAVGERLCAERDRAICGAHGHGVPIAAIARMMKMSDRDVSQIVAAEPAAG
jgi:hypothetical protein